MLTRLYLPVLLSGVSNGHFGDDFRVGREAATHQLAPDPRRKGAAIPLEQSGLAFLQA